MRPTLATKPIKLLWLSVLLHLAVISELAAHAVAQESTPYSSSIFNGADGLTNEIPECCCTKDTVEDANHNLVSILDDLRKTTFFRIFKVALDQPCTFWDNPKFCTRPTCEVCTCDEDQIPSPWLIEDKGSLMSRQVPGLFDGLDRTVDVSLQTWEQDDKAWIVQPPSSEMSYIDLSRNPHGDTGYTGEAPRRVWSAIYGENCFEPDSELMEGLCLEQRVFYRLLSGMQASVSAHVAAKSLSPTFEIRPNFHMYQKALGNHPSRLDGLYFNFVFMVRSLHKARDALLDFNYETGNVAEDEYVQKKIQDLMDLPMIRHCPPSEWFDESALFDGNPLHPQINQFKAHFRNISMILDCVECEKCQLYSKLQILGLGTALKIMFSDEVMSPESLQRNEVIALIMTLVEFSDSLSIVKDFQRSAPRYEMLGIVTVVAALSTLCILMCCMRCMCRCCCRSRSATHKAHKE